jgi:histidine triad (HIT) family protein
MSCIFCEIAVGKVPANIIYQDDRVIAFDDAFPETPIHKLIVPRTHIATINDLKPKDENLVGHMIYVAGKIAKEYGIADDGYRVVMNCNAGGGQAVFHLHLHLMGGRSLSMC